MERGTVGTIGRAAERAAAQGDRLELDRREADRDRRPRFGLSAASRGLAGVFALMAALLVAYVVSVVLRRQIDGWPVLDDWGVAGFELAGSALCLLRAFVGRERSLVARLIPGALGLALLAWSLGDLVLAVYPSDGGSGTPALATVCYLAFYPLAYVGVMLLVHIRAWRLSTEVWLDGVIAGLGAAAIAAALLPSTALHSVGGVGDGLTTNIVLPIGDLLLLALVTGSSAVLPGRRGLPWLLVAVGLAVNAVGDSANLLHSALGAGRLAEVADAVAWPTSILLVSLAVWIRPPATRLLVGLQAPRFTLPALACAASMAMLFVGSLEHVRQVALGLALATLTTAGLRAALSVRTLQRLTLDRHRQAITDQLTTLANRRALYELLDALDQEHATTGTRRRLACLFVDLNRFKEVNDSFGHSVGDELLRQLSERLRGALREGDLLARLGGDEFVVALIDADSERGAATAQRITDRLREPFLMGAVRAQIGASIGIAVAPQDAAGGSELLRCADLAMYRAKVAGEPFAIYREELDGRGNRVGLVEDLRLAIAERHLELHYQPQIDCRSGATVGFEALVRWNHPRLGPLPPLEFLPLAEDADLIDPLMELTLDMAVAQCARWRATGADVSVSVNLSSTNLRNPDLPETVRGILARHGLPASALVLEVTETTAITDFERSQLTILRLRELGLVVSVDDFGAGFTSLAYLSSLAVDELKLDRSFIQDLVRTPDPRNEALVRATIELAHALGLRVVAEGIEDGESYELLTRLGTDLAQGYLISRPRPAAELDLNGEAFRSSPAAELPAL